jgi:hypothetical protein
MLKGSHIFTTFYCNECNTGLTRRLRIQKNELITDVSDKKHYPTLSLKTFRTYTIFNLQKY